MDRFVTASASSKKAHNMMMVSASLPVNILVFGEEGVGRKRLVQSVFPDARCFDAKQLEELFREHKVDLTDDSEVVVYDIDMAGNVGQLIRDLEACEVKIIATASGEKALFQETFLVKVDLPPLRERAEDTEILVEDYIRKAKDLFRIEERLDASMVDINLSKNSISLKESIYRSLLLNSINQTELMQLLEQFFAKEIAHKTDYKELLEIFEIPLLKAMRTKYKSQLQMANKLNINRNTLRKKMYQYGLEEK